MTLEQIFGEGHRVARVMGLPKFVVRCANPPSPEGYWLVEADALPAVVINQQVENADLAGTLGAADLKAAHWLTDGSGLARALCGFIAVYWGVRIVVQFAAYRGHEPQGTHFVAAKYLLLTAFAYCTAIYGAVALAVV